MTIRFLKYLIAYSGGLSFLISISCSFNPYETERGSRGEQIFKVDSTLENKGKYVTSKGELRTLIIYAMFSDDEKTKSNAWNYNLDKLPDWSYKMLNDSPNLHFPQNNLTQYFYEMSRGNLMFYGDIYPEVVVPKFKQGEYKSIAEVNSEILSRLDGEIDFSVYDNWSKDQNKIYVNKPDGQVDAIFIVYRNFENRLFFNNGWTGAAHLYLTSDFKTNDNVTIAKGRLDNGSGIQSRGGKEGFSYMKYVLAHEFGHLLFGAGHIENVTNLALMTGGPVWNASRGMHSWERDKLGWIEFIDIPIKINSSIIMDDYITSGKAYRIKLSDNEWYIFENHQQISNNDWAKDKGIYIYHINNAERFTPTITVKCADGNWDFIIDKEKGKLFKTKPNSNGKSEMNFRKRNNGKSYSCNKQVYGDKSAWGDEYDAFDTEYNNIFSPVSNPNSSNQNKTEFAVEIKEMHNSNVLVNIYFDEIYENSVPSKPQIIEIDQTERSKIKLKWLSNQEPDLQNYNVYYRLEKNSDFKLFEEIASNTDAPQVNISFLLGDKKKNIHLAISAIDNSGKESLLSDYIDLSYSSINKKWNWKRIERY